jgi:TRAP-type transport system periplasmic protein
MKKGLALGLAMLIAACGAAFSEAQNETAENIELIYASVDTPDAPLNIAMGVFKDEVERLSNGRITVELFYNGQLFTQEQTYPALQDGSLDISGVAPNGLAEKIPYLGMVGAVYTFRGYDHMRKVFDGEIGENIFKDVEEIYGFVPLAACYLGRRQLNVIESVGPVRSPEDMKGVKLRTPSSPTWIALGKALGGTPTPMSFGEVYMGLKTGVIEGQDNPIPTNRVQKFYEVTKYIIQTDHVVDTIWPAISKKRWASLSTADQKIVKDAMQKAMLANDALVLEREQSDRAFLESKGTIFIDDPDKEAFQQYARWSYANESKDISKDWDWDLYDRIQEIQ